MLLYITIEAIVAVVAGILIAVCTKKADGVVYGKLDKAGCITNIVLIPIYAFLSLFCIGIGIFSFPGHEGFLRILGWIVAGFIPSAPLFCFIGLGLSVALRKKEEASRALLFSLSGLPALDFLSFCSSCFTETCWVPLIKKSIYFI